MITIIGRFLYAELGNPLFIRGRLCHIVDTKLERVEATAPKSYS